LSGYYWPLDDRLSTRSIEESLIKEERGLLERWKLIQARLELKVHEPKKKNYALLPINSLFPNWNDYNTPTWVNSRILCMQIDLTHAPLNGDVS